MFNFFKKRAAVELDEGTGDILPSVSPDSENINRERALSISTFSACVNMISGDIAKLPIRLYRKTEKGIEEVDDVRTSLLNLDTGDTLTGFEMKKALILDYFLGKGGYCYIEKRGNQFKSLRYVSEGKIRFRSNDDPILKSYSIIVDGKVYPPHNFFRVLRNTVNGREGVPIFEEAREFLISAFSLLKYDINQTATGGNKKGFIKSQRKLDRNAINFIRTQWRKLFSNQGDSVMVLNEGLEFQEVSHSSMEMQLNQNKETCSKDICKLFFMPSNILSGTPTEEDKKLYIEECLTPVISALECSLNRDLLKENEKTALFFNVDTTEFTKGDQKSRYEAYQMGLRNGFLKIDEVRKKENLAPLNINYIKLGLQDILFNPDTKEIFMPNIGKGMNVEDSKTQEGDVIDEN